MAPRDNPTGFPTSRHAGIYERVRTRPPRCLSGFRVRTAGPAVEAIIAELGGDVAMFELLPPSPGETPVLLGEYIDKAWPEDYYHLFRGRILVGPLAIRWEPSGKVVEMFDGSRHGYNGEYALGNAYMPGVTGRVDYRWPDDPCLDPVFVVRLSHSFEESLDLEGDEADRPEDFFDWFTLAAWSRATGSVRLVTDFECA